MVELTMPLLEIELATTARLPDDRIAEWEALGEGEEPLVWIEGGPGLPAHLARADLVPVLDRFRCHLVNAPGSGRSTPPRDESGYDLERLVDFFEAWRQAVGLGPVTVMGHSWGGLVGPAWAALHPASVSRLIVIDGYAGGGSVDAVAADAERARAFDRVRAKPWFEAARRAVEDTVDGVALTEAENVEGLRAIMPLFFADADSPAALAHIQRIRREARSHAPIVTAWTDWREAADYRPLLSSITCPTLVLVGELDWICGPVWARSLASAIPGARLVEIADVGHLPQYEVPAVFRAIIDEWLADVG